jgi:hypothetical protein
MDWLQFVSAITGHLVSLAWPAAVVAVAYLAKQILDATDVGKTQPQEKDK